MSLFCGFIYVKQNFLIQVKCVEFEFKNKQIGKYGSNDIESNGCIHIINRKCFQIERDGWAVDLRKWQI